MNQLNNLTAIVAMFLLFTTEPAISSSDIEEYQLRRLQYPTLAEVEGEQQGKIFIYHEFKDTQVEMAMDAHFDRVQSMMFTGVIVTDTNGDPARDSLTGEVLIEEDGCD